MADVDFQPGTYRVTFERIGAHRPAHLTTSAASREELEQAIGRYANTYTITGDILVCVDPPEPGRSIGAGWITAGNRDAGRFTWRGHAEPVPVG